MDPLSVLRDYTVRGELEKIRMVGEEICFGGEYKFPKNIKTSYRSKSGDYYNLEALVFFIKFSDLKHTEYMQQARAHKAHTVTLPDRKDLLGYLQGRISTTDAIDLVAPLGQEEYRPEDPGLGLGPYENGGSNKKRVRDLDPDRDRHRGVVDIEIPDVREVHYDMTWVKNRERSLKERDALIQIPSKNFLEIVRNATKREEERKVERELERLTPAKRPPRGGTDSLTPAKSLKGSIPRNVSGGGGALKGNAQGNGVPIIIVPSAFQTLLNMYNAKEFLEDGVYISPDAKAKTGAKKPEALMIFRRIGRDKEHPVPYEICDKPSGLDAKDWERVVAVFVLGKEWQFKGFPYKQNVEIFNRYLGFFLRFEDDGLESVKTVKQWNVKIISISKHKRHQDKTAQLEIWDKIDSFLRSRRCNLVF